MRIIEGAVPEWYPGEISKGVEWDQMPVSHPEKAGDDTIPVLVIPIPAHSIEEAKQRIAEVLK